MATLSLNDLIAQLTDLRDSLDPDFADAHVRVAYQPSWPLRGTVSGITTSDDVAAETGDEPEDTKIVWLAIGEAPYDENPYAPKTVFEYTDWS